MKNFLLAFFAICFMFGSYAQNKKKDQEVDIIDHQVQLGESVRLISKKYLVDPAEIYKLNKFAVEGISQGMVLQIPVPRKESSQVKEVGNTASEEIVTNQKSESTPKEASIDNKPTKNESIDENPPLNNDIKKIVIKERKTEVNHKVTPKETLYSLARDFNVSVDDIKANNPEVAKNGLKIGQTIKIPKEKSIDIQQSTSVTETTTAKTEKLKSDTTQDHANQTISESNVQHHKVQPKETLYSLSKKYHVTVDDIKNQNEELLKNGLQIGQTLIIKINN